MATSQTSTRWPSVGLGLVAGAALAVPAAALMDWPLALAVAAGAALGVVAGAVAAASGSSGSSGSSDSRS
ncbi:hypothetical protein [Ornithinimicrobium pekingense]|uniref:Uncharacterized protein n=1 Tax=Ornithinimicrobium pekingense TaxID=384677 RepID=A0ABQ2F853_9MICO|nr:hypothetical protein [Ornithinimicrobium pekingense]GGK69208.1 hypothetical protein GCM10011509_17000 [Ornithinimicrobium pekingense]